MMKRLFYTLCALCFLVTVNLQAQTTVSGVIMDEELNEPLIGANVIIVGTTIGSSTDLDGNYSITSEHPLPWTLEVSYTGFAPKTITATGSNSNLNIDLASSALIGQEVVVSASRRREKIQEAPASISVINARKLAATPNENVVRSIINSPGVTVQQQSAGRINIQLRGDGGLFGSASFPIIDYRSLSGPGLGTFDALNSPINNVDIERIEVVRGPGSALYGPGVTAGVIHFITKSPIDQPGTTVELIGGELNTFGGSFRHATKVSDKFGFKINGVWKRGDEFTLDINDPNDAEQIPFLNNTISRPTVINDVVSTSVPGTQLLGPNDTDPDGDGNPLQDFWEQKSLTANLEFRPADDLSINVSGGYNDASAVFFNSQGEGLSQSRELWGQVRVQKGGLFAQAFYLDNNGSTDDDPTFLYRTGLETGIARQQFEAQVQYNFDTPNLLNATWTTGFDFRTSIADSKNQVYGRNERDDDFSIVGLYLQGKFELANKLDLVLAGRGDRFNFLDDIGFSPRAVLVYKPSPKHTIRGGFNRAISAPSQLQINIDFPVNVIVPGAYDIWLVGNRNEQTFSSNDIVFNPALGFPFPSLPIGTPGLPVGVIQGLVTGAAGEAIQGGVAEQLIAANPLFAGLVPVINDFLNNPANFGQGFTGGFEGFNIFNGQPLGLINAPQATLRTEDTWEIGYKGLIGDKFGVTIDVYNRNIDGATLFTGISPTYRVTGQDGIPGDLGQAVADQLTPFLIEQLTPFADLLPASVEEVAGQIAAGYNAGYAGGAAAVLGSPQILAAFGAIGTTPTDNVPDDGAVHIAAGYRTFEAYDYWGADVGLEYYFNADFSVFGNYSWISRNQFDVQVAGAAEGETETTSIGAPENKYRLGLNYAPEFGFRANLAFQHNDSFFANIGQIYSGDTEATNLFDLGVGYKFNSGLALDVTAQNLFDNEYRAFNNFPVIGRRVLGKLTYSFGGDLGRKQDADGDGISDSKDNCPNTAGLKAFGGCPDSDGDGIMDSADACPLAAGLASTSGCPDGDGDGVADANDACPDVAGKMNGCPDSDGDGIADNADACPNAAGPAGGCPDGDGDGVADKDDACPNAAGTLNGCPDTDGDGVADGNDACPNAAGTVGGCPDGDGDGVADKDDACPTVAASTANGCPADPDSDGDGTPDSRDACPNAAGTVGGCPDGDGDGVADKNDACPTVAASTSNGCPAIPSSVTEVFNRALQGVQFETGKNRIRSASKTILGEVIQIMNQNPSYNLNIGGHTDSIGSSESNQRLSQRRADAVKKYLTDRGIASNRVSAVGYGESQPVADNKYAAGRKQNRRVELSVSYN